MSNHRSPAHSCIPADARPGDDRFDLSLDARELLRACVHCGMCLGACPTYRETGDENNSPRGRVHLMRALAERRVSPTACVVRHLDLCLGCRACESACPSGVHYTRLLEGTRSALSRQRPPAGLTKMVRGFVYHHLFQRPDLLAMAARALRFSQESGLRAATRASGIFRWLPEGFRNAERMQPDFDGPPFLANAPLVHHAWNGKPVLRVAFFSGCVMDLCMGDIHRATVRVLQAHGIEVLTVPGQVCCGALMFHAGEMEAGRALARRNLEIFGGLGIDAIVNNSAGCGSTLKEYATLLPDDPRADAFAAKVKDVLELLSDLKPRRPLKPVDSTVCYDAPCHLLHAQRIDKQPLSVLARIPGIKWRPLPDAEFCCGAAGTYNLTQPAMSQRILARKIEAIRATKAGIVLTGNPGCLIQIQHGCREAGLTCEVLHPMELMARALS